VIHRLADCGQHNFYRSTKPARFNVGFAGIFMAASLQASAALALVECHEYQHSVFEPNRRLVAGDMDCRGGAYTLPSGPGLGVTPSAEALALLQPAH
jgi:galactonate dehydratase